MPRPLSRMVVALLAPLALAGCGEKIAPVKGRVVLDGKPVPVGTVTFAPQGQEGEFEAGRPAVGAPDENGAFELSTHARHDGALVGRHLVTYVPPQAPESSDPEVRKSARFLEEQKNFQKYRNCRLPKDTYVEVKPGPNEITLELVQEK